MFFVARSPDRQVAPASCKREEDDGNLQGWFVRIAHARAAAQRM